MKTLLILAVFLFLNTVMANTTTGFASDLELAKKSAVNDLMLTYQNLQPPNNEKNCEEKDSPAVALCWKKCTFDGWSLSHCVGQCGADTNTGSMLCWDKCNAESWSLNYCAGKCGVTTTGGIEKCWNKCTKDGWSLSYCSNLCGK